nr:DUF202 domain-containing protein [Rhodococcus sp. JVH1]
MLPGQNEPDPRFTLANERTFLAWIRTSLALLAAGIAVEAFATELFADPVRRVVATSLLLLGLALSVGSGVRWLRVERAIRQQAPLPIPSIAFLLLSLGGAVAAATFIAVVASGK